VFARVSVFLACDRVCSRVFACEAAAADYDRSSFVCVCESVCVCVCMRVYVCVHVCMVATRTGVVLDGGDGEERANVDDITEDAFVFCLKEYVHVGECLNKISVAAEHGEHTAVRDHVSEKEETNHVWHCTWGVSGVCER